MGCLYLKELYKGLGYIKPKLDVYISEIVPGSFAHYFSKLGKNSSNTPGGRIPPLSAP